MTGKEYVEELKKNCGKWIRINLEETLNYRKQQLKKFNCSDKELERLDQIYRDNNALEAYIQKLYKDIYYFLPKDAQEKLKDVYIGVLDTFNVNASAIMNNSKCDTPVVILHGQLLAVISQFAELQVLIAYYDDKIQELIRSFHEIIDGYLYQNYAIRLPVLESNLSEEQSLQVGLNTVFYEVFIILHELAHIYLGHLDTSGSEILYLNNEEKIFIHQNNKKKEFEADAKAMKWMVQMLRNENCTLPLRIYRMNEFICFELFYLFHIFDYKANRLDELKKLDNPHRILRVSQNVDNIISVNDNSCIGYPLSIERLLNLITVCTEENYFNEEQVGWIVTHFYTELVVFEELGI